MTFIYILGGIAIGIAAAVLMVGVYLGMVTRRIARSAERSVPPVGKFVDVDGARIHYVESGQGRPILLIHGLGGHLHHMRRPLMDAFGDGFRLVAPDRPGSGYSTRPVGQGRLSEHVRFIVKFMEATGMEKPLLVGHSLGGAIALATALAHPDRVAGLALIAPLTHAEKVAKAEFANLAIKSPLMRRVIAHTIAVPASVRQAPQVLDFVFGPQQPPHDYAVEGGAMVGLRPSHFYATSTDFTGLRHELAEMSERYGELAMPVGIFFGTADRVLDHQRHGASLVGRIEGLDLELADGIGHMPQYVVTDRVVAFIRRVTERAFAGQAADALRPDR
jgi:pimeloyl-ACP methyl ester carboxylesterase